MRKLLLLLPLLFIAGCGKYGSYAEADKACVMWRLEKGSFETANSVHSKAFIYDIRECLNEGVTSQILGYEYSKAEAGTTYILDDVTKTFTNENGKVMGNQVIAKRFKY